jgi:phospholipid transport system substrate-binding protein
MTLGGKCLRLGLITLAFWWGGSSQSFADAPTEQIKKTIDRVMVILHSPTGEGEAFRAEKRAMLREVILARFDFPEMARRSLGTHWARQNGRQKEFVSAFTNFLVKFYVSKVESFKDEKVVYIREHVDKGSAEVDTKIVPSMGDHFSVNYKLHLVRGEWRVYDVVLENVSFVSNYRSQFNRILTSASFDELLRKLKEKGSVTGN